ncbi:hypothetical protein STCU_11258 [Strigomonas culicis]|uniref:Flagellum targeting protein kharon1 n=1 Tax=Strigomonas culicis TaxID=28005 RepID=S9TJ81_9TRYP|nr:hypothetical protein STCU_11258 [Strigomonas culicis]|eukprot:EPY16443.1 hypothetical protein STCU_11258 [Strigomonas culicis]
MSQVQSDKFMSARQRGVKSRSGVEASKLMRTAQPQTEEEERRPVRRNPQVTGHFSSASDFHAGPRKAGNINKGIRRFQASDEDHVGYMMTDEFAMSNAGAVKAKIRPHDRSALNAGCGVMTEEAAFRPGHRITHPEAPMDAPFFEDNNPKGPRDAEAPAGKRRVKPPVKEQASLIRPQPVDADDAAAVQTHSITRSYKSNKSRNVMTLAKYTGEELNEAPQRELVLGPRKFVAPDVPPLRNPTLRQINTHAKDEHDVLCNGRFGKPEPVAPQGKAHGSCRPLKQQANIFAGCTTTQEHKSADVPAPKVQRDNILRYYDANLDNPVEFSGEKQRLARNRTNIETMNLPQPPMHRGRAHGACSTAKKQTALW